MSPPCEHTRNHLGKLSLLFYVYLFIYLFVYSTGECSPATKWRSLDSIQKPSTSCWWILYQRMTTDTNSQIINGRHAWGGQREGGGTRPLGCPGGRILSISGSSCFFHAKCWAAGASPEPSEVFPQSLGEKCIQKKGEILSQLTNRDWRWDYLLLWGWWFNYNKEGNILGQGDL